VGGGAAKMLAKASAKSIVGKGYFFACQGVLPP